jgi:hypothetical protein
MSDDSSQNDEQKGDRWVDAVAAVVLIAIAVTTFAYWAYNQ